jgi:putative ABC transport system permease protein
VSRHVPLARRALFQDRRRASLAAGGVAAVLLLVLMLQGIFDGAMQQVTLYLRQSPADVIVSQADVRTMHMSVSTLPPETVDAVAGLDGVAWAEGIRYTTTIVARGERQQLSYVIGYDPVTGRGGPSRITSGQSPAHGEIIVEAVAADRLGVHIGDELSLFGQDFRLSGLFTGGTTIANSLAFITSDDFAAQRGPTIAYVLVGAGPGVPAGVLAERVARALPEETVQTRQRFADEEAALVKDMSADIMQLMALISFLIGLAVISLTLFTLTLSKLREHAIVKALGAPNRRLVTLVLHQAAWLVAMAVSLATVLAVGLGRLIGEVNPAITVAVEPSQVLRVAVATMVVGVLGAVLPLRRVTTVDPASAFRRAT